MRYDISGTLLQTLTLHLAPGDLVYSQTHSMAWMTEGVKVATHTGGGLWEGVKRAFSGSSFFITEFQCDREAQVAFAARYPGTIVPLELGPGQAVLCRRESFLCAQRSVGLELAFHNPDVWLFGGQGLAMQKAVGPGTVFLDLSGEVVVRTLAPGEKLHLRPGHVGMLDPTVRFEVEMVEGVSNMLFGQGLFMATLTGPGRVWLQTMPLEHLVEALGIGRSAAPATTARSRRQDREEPKPEPTPSPRPPRSMVGKLFDFLFDEGPVLGPGPVGRKLDTVIERSESVRERAPRPRSDSGSSGFGFGLGSTFGGGSSASDSSSSSSSSSSRDDDKGKGSYGINF